MKSQDIPAEEKYGETYTTACLLAIFSMDFSWVERILKSKYKRKRRPPHPPLAMFKALLYQRFKQIQSWRKLGCTLENDHDLTMQLGFSRAPHHSCFSEFAIRIGDETITDLFYAFVEKLREQIPDLGKNVVAADATLVRGYTRSRPRKQRKTDPDAAWGVSGDKLGKPVFVYGSKLFVNSDTGYELPLTFSASPANVPEITIFRSQLTELLDHGNKPEVLVADAGFDSKLNKRLCMKYGITPVIARNPRRSGSKRSRFDQHLPIQPDTELWNHYYRKRSEAERLFSRLKLELGLLHLKRRTLPRVKFHFGMCLIAMLAVALASFSSGRPELSLSVEQWRY